MLDLNIFENKVAHSLMSRGYAPFRPVKDVGVDFLAVHKESGGTVRLQVKGSTLHGLTDKCEHCGGHVAGHAGGWFDIDVEKARRQAEKTDFYIFIWANYRKAGRMALSHYLIVPTTELLRRIASDKTAYPTQRIWRQRYRPWFVVEQQLSDGGAVVLDLAARNKKIVDKVAGTDGDFSGFYRNWAPVEELCKERARGASLAV